MENPKHIIDKFDLTGSVVSVKPLGIGNINDSYVVKCDDGSAYAFQRINTDVFTKPAELMSNVVRVTAHIREKLKSKGLDPKRGTLSYIPLKCGEGYMYSCDKGVFRMYDFIDDVITIQQSGSCEDAYNTAFAFGEFQSYLSDFDASTLYETIPNFHYTPSRVDAFKKALKADKCGRAAEVSELIEKYEKASVIADKITNPVEEGILPIRVTHNDTKINNILFDSKTKKGLCIIDLDTVMPATLLYDFGDMIRTGAAMTEEDEADLTKVGINIDYYRSFVKGFIDGVGGNLENSEISRLALSSKMMAFECGIRFLTDYLNGDTYFAIRCPNHNYLRAANQMKLLEDMEQKYDLMLEAENEYIK